MFNLYNLYRISGNDLTFWFKFPNPRQPTMKLRGFQTEQINSVLYIRSLVLRLPEVSSEYKTAQSTQELNRVAETNCKVYVILNA